MCSIRNEDILLNRSGSVIVADWTITKDIGGQQTVFNPGDLVQKCNNIESYFANAGMYGDANEALAIWLKSSYPIEPENVRKALLIIARRYPQLQFCFAKKLGSLWFKLMDDFQLDFETTTNDPMKTYSSIVNDTIYNLWKGPLWKVGLVLGGEKSTPYSAVLIFAMQHSIADGISMVSLCRETVKILNTINAQNDIRVVKMPMPPSIEDFLPVYSSSFHYLKFVLFKIKTAVSMLTRTVMSTVDLGQNLKQGEIRDGESKLLLASFSEIQTKALLFNCKSKNITVNSLITTLINFAFLSYLQSKSKVPIGNQTIKVAHCVNLRRHFDSSYKETSGCHLSFFEDEATISADDVENIWKTTSNTQLGIIKGIQKENMHLKTFTVVDLLWMISFINSYLSKLGVRNLVDCHYISSNLGNITNLQPESLSEDDIEISYLLRSANMKNGISPCMFMYHTFKGRFLLSLDYYSNKMSESNAKYIFQYLCQSIREIASTNDEL